MKCIAGRHGPPRSGRETPPPTEERARARAPHLRPGGPVTVRRIAAGADPTPPAGRSASTAAGTAFALHHRGSRLGDLLSPEFSPDRTGVLPLPPRPEPVPGQVPEPARRNRREPPGTGRVIPLRPGSAGWAQPLADGRPLILLPGHGRHHRPEPRRYLSLEKYSHRLSARVPAGAESRNSSAAGTSEPAPVPLPTPAEAAQRPRTRWRARRVRTYVSHPGRDMAPLALAVRAYLRLGVK